MLCRLTVVLLMVLFGNPSFAWHQILSPTVKSLQVDVNNDWLSMPVMTLGSSDVLNISFDELSHDYHRYIAHVEHCEADWSPSTELFESDWLVGFNDIPIDDYEKSLNTTTLYTNYSIQFPNSKCRLKMSGNYKVHILDEDNDNEEVLTVEFRVVDPRMDVGLSVTTNTDLALNGRYQQVAMTLNYNGTSVVFPDEELQIFVMQNGREDNMKENVRPNYITQKGLKWEHNRGLIFDGGNEYHKFEVLNPSHTTMGLEHVHWDEDEGVYHVFPFRCEPQRHYLYDEDADGAFLIRNSDYYESNRLSDYVYVHYKLAPARYYADTKIVVDGKWAVEPADTYVMTYDESDQSYNATILQKLGYYNYQLRMLDADGITHPVPEEGSFYETENRYQAFVYYKRMSSRTWELVGYQEIVFRPQ
jgi:hypothetical protein